MITQEAASLAISIAKGLITLSRRIDLLLAEKEAVQAPMALPVPGVGLMPKKAAMIKGLKDLLDSTKNMNPNPLGNDRIGIEQITASSGDKSVLFDYVRKYLPKLAISRSFDLNETFIVELKKARPGWASDPDKIVAAFYISAGDVEQKTSYPWRIALTIVDVLAEFGAGNAALFARDKKVQGVISSVLQRIAVSDLQELDSKETILRAALSATLNGVLDAREHFAESDKWLDATLDAVVIARDSLPKNQRDNFLLGFFQGRSYPTLVAALLERGAKQIDTGSETDIRDAASDLMRKIAGIIKNKPDFDDFFKAHWGDLLRAGFSSVEKYGPELLGDKKLLGQILKRIAGDLANHSNSRLLGSDALYGIVNSTAAVVAANPELASNLLGPNRIWIDLLVSSVAKTVNEYGTGSIFTKAGVEELFKDAFETFGEHPELIAGDSELAAKLIGDVLKSLEQSYSFAAGDLAKTAVTSTLDTLSANPQLIKFDYPGLAAGFAANVSTLVKNKEISRIEAIDILDGAIRSLAKNPELFLKIEDTLAEGIVKAVFGAMGTDTSGLIAGAALSRLVSEVVSALAKTGKAALKNHPLAELVAQLEQLITAGLKRAQSELGHTLDLPSLPGALGLLVEAWAKGNVATLDPENDNFRALFAELSALAAA